MIFIVMLVTSCAAPEKVNEQARMIEFNTITWMNVSDEKAVIALGTQDFIMLQGYIQESKNLRKGNPPCHLLVNDR
jgi:hypothetical protein